MFLSRNKKVNVHPCKTQFYCIKVGFKGSKLHRHVFVMLSFEYIQQNRGFNFRSFQFPRPVVIYLISSYVNNINVEIPSHVEIPSQGHKHSPPK